MEPGGYSEDNQYRWYIGNGDVRDDTFDYLVNQPIQEFDGSWIRPAEGPVYWGMEGNTPFVLHLPQGQVETGDGMVVSCFALFNMTVDLTLEPRLNGDGLPEVGMNLTGFMRQSDAEMIHLQFNGVWISLSDLFDFSNLTVDTTGDGVPDAYPFNLSMTAGVAAFGGDPPAADGSNRDPRLGFQNPPGCE